MRSTRWCAALAASLALLASCNDSPTDSSSAEDRSFDVSPAEDLSKLPPEELAVTAQAIAGKLAAALREVDSVKASRKLVDRNLARVDQLLAAKDALKAQKVDLEPLKEAVAKAYERHGNDEEVMTVLQPFLDRIKALWS